MGLNSVSMSKAAIDWIKTVVPAGSTILELGSGDGTISLSNTFKMYSVENQVEWMNKYPLCTTYINCHTRYYDDEFTAPDIEGSQTAWYNPDTLFSNLPEKYDALLIDGPGGKYGRGGFFKFIDKFNTNVPMFFDDVNRGAELDLMKKVSLYVNRPYQILETDKALGYIL